MNPRIMYSCNECSAPCYGVAMLNEDIESSQPPQACVGGYSDRVRVPVWVLETWSVGDGKV